MQHENVHSIEHLEFPFLLAGAGCLLRTNSDALIRLLSRQADAFSGKAACTLEINVVAEDDAPIGTAHFRGLHHLVVVSFGVANVFAFDLLRGLITARVSNCVAADADFWRWTLLPIVAGVMGATMSVLPVHSACLSRNGVAMLIAGQSGAGKSTLALALARRGFDYLSDDWTYCSSLSGRLQAYGTGARLKLLPDAGDHFPELKQLSVGKSMNGELAFEVIPGETFDITAIRQTTPKMLFFYSRDEHSQGEATRLDRSATRQYLENSVERLPTQLAQASVNRSVLMDAVAALPCWRFVCSGPPDAIAASVEAFYDQCAKEIA